MSFAPSWSTTLTTTCAVMGWLLGYVGAGSETRIDQVLKVRRLVPSFTLRDQSVFIAAGGIPETCCFGKPGTCDGATRGWLALGFAVRNQNGRWARLNETDWGRILVGKGGELDSLNGHFLAVIVGVDEVTFRNDRLGLRTAYLQARENATYFSTRLDLLSAVSGAASPNLSVLGAQWLSFNRVTPSPLLRQVQALPPGGTACITRNALTISAGRWDFPAGNASSEDVRELLTASISRALFEPRGLSLGLSGGLDSRAVMSVLLGSGSSFASHAFGSSEDMDVAISRRIARAHGIPHSVLSDHEHQPSTLERCLLDYGAHVQANFPASQSSRTTPYSRLHEDHLAIVDGGFGEIGRRQFLNRLLLRNRASIASKDAERIAPHLRASRASIFAPDVMREMERGAIEEVGTMLSSLPDPASLGVENFLDLLAVRSRLPFYFGVEQTRLDTLAVTYMPFAQPDVVAGLLSLPLTMRRSGRFFRQLIRAAPGKLAAFPLVKGDERYPFSLGPVAAHVYTSVVRKTRPRSPASKSRSYLMTMRPVVDKWMNARSFAECDLYDHDAVRRITRQFYAPGSTSSGNELDWWLSFEAWRRSLSDESWG